ncbi:jg570, partial [Pararge aegeria aegeria]
IESVRRFPCLWNTTAIEYRDQELKDAAWAEVMKETDLSSVKEVKLKWKKLRDSYRDALKRHSEMLAKEPGATPAPKKTYPWKYMAPMQFLQPHMNVRKKVPHHTQLPSTLCRPTTEHGL